ncbi:MAG: hypothetical protein J5944_06340 [Lentisphaeria bacterium]|nr:hypothetical protein [Lentisphaeria bacterium]
MRLALLPVLACTTVFLQGCACSMKEDMAELQKENLDLNRDLMGREIALHDKDVEIKLLKKDMEARDTRNEEKKKEMEKKIAELESKLARSVSIDLFFKGNPFNIEMPPEILDIWLKENRPPENPTKAQLKAFADKLPSVARYGNYEITRRKLLAQVHELPEDFLKDLILADTQNVLGFIFEDAARGMDKETLMKYIQFTEGRNARWHFMNRIAQVIDESDRDFIIKNFWNNQSMQKKAIEYGFHKELLPQIKERVRANILQYPELTTLVLPEFTEEEKNDMLGRAWEQMNKYDILNGSRAEIFLKNGFVPAFEKYGIIAPFIRNNNEIPIIEKYSPVGIGDLQDWIIKNKGNIVFDRKTGKFAAGNKADQE